MTLVAFVFGMHKCETKRNFYILFLYFEYILFHLTFYYIVYMINSLL